MSEPLRRTPDWDQLKEADFFQIVDLPGEISLSRASPAEKKIKFIRTIALLLPLGGALLGFMFFPVGLIICVPIALVFSAVWYFGVYLSAKAGLKGFADRVIFTADRIYFYTGDHEHGSLRREALQQIVPDRNKGGMRSHKFLADTGYTWAFPMSSETEHLLMNNILMAAFKQPVHLDGLEETSGTARVAETTAAPQISGL